MNTISGFQVFSFISQLGYEFPEADLGFSHYISSILSFHVNLTKKLLLQPSETFITLIRTLNLIFKAVRYRDNIVCLRNKRYIYSTSSKTHYPIYYAVYFSKRKYALYSLKKFSGHSRYINFRGFHKISQNILIICIINFHIISYI